ncbi:hypothetical protein DM01DRAFT_1383031 [Hesseltinella vesiculosa]|uniref:Uncharacterized protein n=1 Tax=Hesseltinella vesiculosa TaxID=101127 RepID=A0A1X2GJF5_9FUNG|nr:hypothetical protein DM01DRAFT_1383031 [Hesseltinella vesiculosa]
MSYSDPMLLGQTPHVNDMANSFFATPPSNPADIACPDLREHHNAKSDIITSFFAPRSSALASEKLSETTQHKGHHGLLSTLLSHSSPTHETSPDTQPLHMQEDDPSNDIASSFFCPPPANDSSDFIKRNSIAEGADINSSFFPPRPPKE